MPSLHLVVQRLSEGDRSVNGLQDFQGKHWHGAVQNWGLCAAVFFCAGSKECRGASKCRFCPSNITRWALKSKIPAHQSSNNNPITPTKGLALTDDLAMSLIRHTLLSKWCVLRLLTSVREWVDIAFFSVIWNELLEIETLKKNFRLVISF